MRSRKLRFVLFAVLLLPAPLAAKSFKYMRLGNKQDVTTQTSFGIVMLGGGGDIDDAFRFLCQKANGGDILVLRARGNDEYNPYINGLCKVNSVATLVIPNREAALQPEVADIIQHAEAVFIGGGDQSRYITFWLGTPVQQAINAGLAAGKPIGGTSAGLAVLGEFAYGALGDRADDKDLASAESLANPYFPRVTVVRDFLKVPRLENVITDSHFAKRNRLGRTLVFLARIEQDGWSKDPRDVAIDEASGVLVEADGKGKVVGPGRGAYFLRLTQPPELCRPGTPLTLRDVAVYHAPAGASFDLASWKGEGGEAYSLSVESGKISSTKAAGEVY